MKHSTKIFLLVAVALLLLLTACNRSVSKPPVLTPTPSAEAPFPFTTPDAFSAIKTQTAIALFPQAAATSTPEVVVATVEPTAAAPDTGTTSGDTETSSSETGSSATSQEQPAAPSVSIPEIVRPATYILQKGEWPLCIARRFNLDISSFLSANNMNMDSKPGVGVVLTIPASGSWSANYGSRALRSHPATYTVASGDTINSIACKFGDVSPEQILAASGLSSGGDISSGMKLNIP